MLPRLLMQPLPDEAPAAEAAAEAASPAAAAAAEADPPDAADAEPADDVAKIWLIGTTWRPIAANAIVRNKYVCKDVPLICTNLTERYGLYILAICLP